MRRIRRWLFIKLWAKNTPRCKTCGANELHNMPGDTECLRLRFTDRFLIGAMRP